MSEYPESKHRQSVRLKNYDYSSSGAYFITICAHGQRCIFGRVVDGEMLLAPLGVAIGRIWREIPRHYDFVKVDAFIVMPNHIHGIVLIKEKEGRKKNPKANLGGVIRGFKAAVTQWARKHTGYEKVWQRNYFDRVLKGRHRLEYYRYYIRTNPERWRKRA